MTEARYVSRAGLKLEAALKHFGIDPAGWTCADLGSNVGGFVDCLLQHGAARVYAVETGYGILAWHLRRDARVVVMERTNAMHATLPEKVDLVTIDVGWTRQKHILPAAARMLKPTGLVLTLVKPHYEAAPHQLRRGVLPPEALEGVLEQVRRDIADAGWNILGRFDSPIAGHAGNREVWLLLKRRPDQNSEPATPLP